MQRIAPAARLLLGLIFVVAGAAKFVFIAHPPPPLVNILVFHATMMPIGIFPGLLVTALWIVAALPFRGKFAPLLDP